MNKYIVPNSVRINGLPGIDDKFGIRDNGSGQLWSSTRRVGSINYRTGLATVSSEHVPKIQWWAAVLVILGIKSAAIPDVNCEYEVTDLDGEGYLASRSTARQSIAALNFNSATAAKLKRK